ncbi:MAG: zinc-dependent metalloprotease [Gemmatimonadota bacterium]
MKLRAGPAALTLLVWLPFAGPAAGQTTELPTIEDKTRGMERLEGFFDLYWDEGTGKLYWEIDRWDEEFLYQVSLATGLGSNPVGLDRGQVGTTRILTAHRVGPKILLVEPNYRYRARTADPAERRAVAEAFAPSTLWGFERVAATGELALVDATGFFLRDAHGIVGTLKRTGQGSFKLDASRSAVYPPRTKAFPNNTEVEVSLTFTSPEPGPLVRQTAASGQAVTLRVHHSLVRLPEAGYTRRVADPRVGAFGIEFKDYATPIDRALDVRWASRHRLSRADPSAPRSRPVEPIVYYVDPGIPEPIRSAVIEGASWWNQAFEAAGYIDAFRVEVLPEGVDPMDLRYNVIHWTHRSTRGWSYGASVVDPRTGEILKGNVNLGSLRLRQDYLIGLGVAPPYGSASGGGDASDAWRRSGDPAVGACDLSAGPDFDYLSFVAGKADPVRMALARIRQLTAHEVGHTLGLAHNFIASTYGRASVMDYPAPLVRITPEGTLDLSDAYAVGIGEYDRFAIRWLYSDFPPGVDEKEALEGIVRDGLARGLRFITDADARPPGAAHPLAHLWDNGDDPIAALRTEEEVRRIGLARFGETAIRVDQPLASLEEVLVPLYLHHRYQLEAAVRSLGGADYSYAVRGDGQVPIRVIPAARQREALRAALETLSPDFLSVPERILSMLPPRAFGMSGGETFHSGTRPTFDPLGVAASAADLTVGLVLQPERMARLVEYHARNEADPGLDEVTDRLLAATWQAPLPRDGYHAEVARTVQRVVLDRLLQEAANERNTPAVRAELAAAVEDLAFWLEGRPTPTPHQKLALADIRRWERRTGDWSASRPPELPPGSPIGHH